MVTNGAQLLSEVILFYPSEQNYCPLEGEVLSIVFGCHHFNEHIYGRHFTLNNDHQLLKGIFSKPLSKAPPRIQQFMMCLQRYEFTLEHVKGKFMVVTDTMSRTPLANCEPEMSPEDMNTHIHSVMSTLPVCDAKYQEFLQETTADNTLQTLHAQIERGWPDRRHDP